jgi:hypothetical protein
VGLSPRRNSITVAHGSRPRSNSPTTSGMGGIASADGRRLEPLHIARRSARTTRPSGPPMVRRAQGVPGLRLIWPQGDGLVAGQHCPGVVPQVKIDCREQPTPLPPRASASGVSTARLFERRRPPSPTASIEMGVAHPEPGLRTFCLQSDCFLEGRERLVGMSVVVIGETEQAPRLRGPTVEPTAWSKAGIASATPIWPCAA